MNVKVVPFLILALFLIAPSALAQQEYNYSAGFDFTPRDIFGSYYYQYSPKVACSPDYSACAALVFQDNSAFGRGLKLYYTTQGFTETSFGFPSTEKYTFTNSEYSYRDDTSTGSATSASEGALNITRGDGYNFPLGYDIWYNEADQEWWIIYAPRSSAADSDSAGCERYSFQAGRSPEVQSEGSCGTNYEGPGGSGTFTTSATFGPPLSILNKDSSTPTYTRLHLYCGSSILATCSGTLNVQEYYLLNNTFITSYTIASPTCRSGPVGGVGDGIPKFFSISGIINDDDITAGDFRYNYGCGGAGGGYCQYPSVGACQGNTYSSMGSFPTTEVGYNYYESPYLYYLRDDYSSSISIWKTTTTDFSSYSDTDVYYLMNSSIGEYINASSESITVASQYVYEYQSYDTNNLTRSVAYDVPLFPIVVSSRHFAPNTENPLSSPASVTATIECPNGFTTSDIGTDILLGSQCTSDITLDVDTSVYRPVHAENTFDVQAGCSGYIVYYYFLDGSYSIPIEVRDLVTKELIPNVTVTVGAATNTTDSEGIAYFNVQPLSSAYFKEVQESACLSKFEPYGTPQTFFITATNPDYLDFETQDEFAYFNNDNETRYLPLYQIYMTPDAAIREVHVRTSDGVEITPTNTRMYAYGANDTSVLDLRNDQIYNVNFITEFPNTFIFVDDRSSFPINFTYEYFSKTYYENLTVTKGTSEPFFFDLPESSINSSCLTSDDCLPSFCSSSNVYAQLIGCNIPSNETQGICEYSYQACSVGCDEDLGCYSIPTTTSCTENYDCLNLSYCVGLGKSKTALCGSQGYCLYKDITCHSPDFCDDSLVITNVTGTPLTTEMCRTTFLCVLSGGIREKFTIRTATSDLEYALTGEPWKDVVDVDYRCDIQNAGSATCISGITLPQAQANAGVVTFPENWAYSTNSTQGVQFYDIAVACSDGCNITYEFCPHGCALGSCLTAPLSTEATARNWIQAIRAWWITLFPTIWDQAFMWTIISLIGAFGLAGGLAVLLRGGGGGGIGGQEIGSVFLGSAIAFFLLGVFLGTMPIFMGVIFAILAGFLVWQVWRG